MTAKSLVYHLIYKLNILDNTIVDQKCLLLPNLLDLLGDKANECNESKTGNKPMIVHETPDQGWAWVVSLACAAINGITFGLVRAYGVVFFQLLDTYKLSREAASWPFCLCTTFTHLSGPVAGLLLVHFSMRTVVFIGGLIAAIGMILCYFSTSIIEITIYIGVIQGFGIGLSFMQTPVILAQYFQKFRATATAISYAGGTIGSFIFPPIIEYILPIYGLNGSFLIIGGILLNSLPFALLLRPATPRRKVNTFYQKVNKHLSVIKKTGRDNFLPKKQTIVINNQPNKADHVTTLIANNIDMSTMTVNDNLDNSVNNDLIENSLQLEYNIQRFHRKRSFFVEFNDICIKKQIHFEEESVDDMVNDKAIQTELSISKWQNRWQNIKVVITNPLYLILCTTHVSFQWAWMTHQMIIIDYAIDRGMTTTQAVILLSSFAGADLFGRLASGLIADKRLVRKRNIVSICILLIGVLIFMTPSAYNFRILLIITIVLGFVCGSIIVLFSVLTMDYVGLNRLPIALSTSALIVGISTLGRPLVVGYFRDTFGSYDGLFHFVGFLALLAALLWLSEPFARLWQMRRQKYGDGFKISVV